MTEPVLPAYGTSTLADLLPSLASGFGLPGATNRLGLPAAERVVVLLVDGLGWHLLNGMADVAPYLCELMTQGRPITSGVPSTTATSITSLGTGLTPGQHGLAGYTFRFGGDLLNALLWRPGLVGLDVQPQLTYFERLTKAGIRCSSVTPARFAGSGLTSCALRGTDFLGVVNESDTDRRIALTGHGASAAERTLTYVYERELDHTGHAHGVDSQRWRAALASLDRFLQRLRAELPSEVLLVVTGDHGMVDVAASDQLVIEDEPALIADVAMIGGEGRLRQLYVRPGTAAAVQGRWADRMGNDAWVLTRDEAIAADWFGPTSPRLADRFGDVLVAMAGPGALMTRTQPKEFTLVGMHGSLTAAEMAVPLLVT